MSGQVLHPNGGRATPAETGNPKKPARTCSGVDTGFRTRSRPNEGVNVMDPKRKPADDETAADPDKNARLETYEQEVQRASVESIAEHPDGSAPPLERLVGSHPNKQRK